MSGRRGLETLPKALIPSSNSTFTEPRKLMLLYKRSLLKGSMDEIDWLRRVEQGAWWARVRQLRRELMEERTKQQIPKSAPQDVALPSNPNNTHLSGASALDNTSATRKNIAVKESSHADIRKVGADH